MIEQSVGLMPTTLCSSAPRRASESTILEASSSALPPPKGNPDAPLQALIFDSWFDPYRGVIVLTRIFEGTMRKGMKIRLWSNGKVFEVESLGVLTPKPVEIDDWSAGEVGFMSRTSRRSPTRRSATPSPTTTSPPRALPGFQEIKPMVFAGLYPVDAHEYGRCATRWKNCG